LAVSIADVLGPDRRLETVALRRLRACGVDPADPEMGVLLAAAGSSHAPANAAVSTVAHRWGAVAAFASAATPDVATAAASSRARGARRIAVASWFLAPGRLPDRVRAQALAVDPDALVA